MFKNSTTATLVLDDILKDGMHRKGINRLFKLLSVSGRNKMSLLDDLTQEQRDAVEEFKKRNVKYCTSKMLDDESLFYRFMKARDFKIEDAEAMFQKHLTWRKEYQVETLLTDYVPPEVLVKYSPNSLIGFDKEGSLIRYCDVGGSDTKGLLLASKKIDFVKYNLQVVEQDIEVMKKQTEKLGKPVTNFIFIHNYDKMTFAKATYKPALEMIILGASMFQDNHPERIKSVYIINASVYFTVIFSVIKHILAPALVEKIKVFGKDGWKEALLKVIDADQLPAFLGGNKTDPDGDPMCRTFVVHGELVPEHYLLNRTQLGLAKKPGVKKIKLSPFSKHDVKFEVDNPGSILEWEFQTKNQDIGFGVYYKESSSSNASEVFPKQRIETCFEPEVGMWKCEAAGTYTIVFDNSYSWIHSKEIYFKANILEPNAIDSQCV